MIRNVAFGRKTCKELFCNTINASSRHKSTLSAIKSGLRKTESFSEKPRSRWSRLQEESSVGDRKPSHYKDQKTTLSDERSKHLGLLRPSTRNRDKWDNQRSDYRSKPRDALSGISRSADRARPKPDSRSHSRFGRQARTDAARARASRSKVSSTDEESRPVRRTERSTRKDSLVFRERQSTDRDSLPMEQVSQSSNQLPVEQVSQSSNQPATPSGLRDRADVRASDENRGNRMEGRPDESSRSSEPWTVHREPRFERTSLEDGMEGRPDESSRSSGPWNLHREPRFERNSAEEKGFDPRRRSFDARDSVGRSPRDEMITIPYTTAGSEFIYGINSVIAALKARRRKLYKLYINKLHTEDKGSSDGSRRDEVLALAKQVLIGPSKQLPYESVKSNFLPTMDKMASYRPHNGVVLEASPLPFPPVASLGKSNPLTTTIPLHLDPQPAEEQEINASASHPLSKTPGSWRQPLVLFVDGILDPGNLGNIIRTAHFYGADAVAICVNTCAPITKTIVVKASSGAAEAVRLFAVHKPSNFIREAAINGWTVCAAVAPQHNSARGNRQLSTATMTTPVATAPTVLMIGSEGEGLRKNLRDKARYEVYIEGGSGGTKLEVGVDSLNVSAATAVLLEAFMRKPVQGAKDSGSGSIIERIF